MKHIFPDTILPVTIFSDTNFRCQRSRKGTDSLQSGHLDEHNYLSLSGNL